MDFLELNIHQQILSDIATNVGPSTSDASFARDTLASRVHSKIARNPTADGYANGGVNGVKHEERLRSFMPASRVQCNIAFGELVVNFSDAHISESLDTLLPVLLGILEDIPYIDFDRSLLWMDWALPDQLMFSTVSALLRIAGSNPQIQNRCIEAIFKLISQIVAEMRTSDSVNVLTQLTPAMHGFYRALGSMSFPWNIQQWKQLTVHLKAIYDPEIVERLNQLLVDIIEHEDPDSETFKFVRTFISRYTSQGRPPSGYFLVCCVIETEWTVLAQVLRPELFAAQSEIAEAAAANKAWLSLMRNPAIPPEYDADIAETLEQTIRNALQSFSDLMVQVDEMEGDSSLDTYAWETMSETLKLASVCSLALGKLDADLYSHLQLLLSDESPIFDNLIQESALKATTVLVRSFPEIASTIAHHLRRFVTAPLPIFEFEFASESRAPPPLSAAAKCFAVCVKLAPGEDLIMSSMYWLLNFISAASKETYDNNSQVMHNPLHSTDGEEPYVSESGLRGLSDDERRLVGISTISVVTRLALEFKMEEVTRLTISMLLQRLRSAEPTVEAAMAYNLVDLALFAPENAFIDIIRVFSIINRSANQDDPRFSNNMVLAAQTRLAQELYRRPELYEIYLTELLNLFVDRGIAIQNTKIGNPQVNTDDMIEQLASLLLPIDALLSHSNFDPRSTSNADLVSLFRSLWLLCVLFNFTAEYKEQTAMDWLRPALTRIACQTPVIVIEQSQNFFASAVQYNSVIRQEYADMVIAGHKATLTRYTPLRSADIKHLPVNQVMFLLMMHDIETMRSATGHPHSLVSYFINDSVNEQPIFLSCMESIAEKVIRGCISDLNAQASQQVMPSCLSKELRDLLISSTHRILNVRTVSSKYLDRLISSFPSLMCDQSLVFAILEALTLLQQACENAFTDEHNPVWEFHSDRVDITLQLVDDYQIRNGILNQLLRSANQWFTLALGRSPSEFQSTLQNYLSVNKSLYGIQSVELGASIAEKFGKDIAPVHRQLVSMYNMSKVTWDGSRGLSSQLASKGYYAGEAAGIQLAMGQGTDKVERLPPMVEPSTELRALKTKLDQYIDEVHNKQSTHTVHEMKRLLFRCAAAFIAIPKCDYDLLHYLVSLPFEVGTPPAIATGIELWNWVIAEKPSSEVALIGELLNSWADTIQHEKGFFSTSHKQVYDDPFNHPIDYSPTNKDIIDRDLITARRSLTPHALVVQMLYSRLQAARYRRSGILSLIQHLVLRTCRAHKSISTHALSRESRFAFLLFGFETLKSSYLDAYCENILRESLYTLAYAWFAVRPQWSYGANRVQIEADIQVLSELRTYLQHDSVRSLPSISSLSPAQFVTRSSIYTERLQIINLPLRLLVDEELSRLHVWADPTGLAGRAAEHVALEKNEAVLLQYLRTVWQINPAIAIHMTERIKYASLRQELIKLVKSSPLDVVDIQEALPLLVGDKVDAVSRRDLKYLLLWAAVPPVIAITFFEPRYQSDPLILQYAHRVLEQHPVELTFFFVPQVVQALRYDRLGYVAQLIFETSKISQLFCHQIIWNMKANTFKDDAAETPDPMKPTLDVIVERIVNSLSGEARSFYDREFKFFEEVTSISGKLKPFIKKSKPEKKEKIDEEMAKITVDVGVYLPSNPDGVVVDIDKKSGRPLQSHAKAPFMATFKVQKERTVLQSNPDSLLDGENTGPEVRETYDVWQQAIFKVGDDCRQDILALQVIAMFKNIYTSLGLTLYLFPYRVIATAPGCGVIDVVPNATSRDEMGRAKVNSLIDFFKAKYGGPDTVEFQKARLNFIQSMAAYSVACYILQIKDRHNGNIMIDGDGHIIHIDFGFLFDIDKYTLKSFES
ncbi:hypothetical protein AX16_008802 [Volvariella volvacea WC 439]|nr:hypothetical protein AX16_008802 [Volvariella volvacea WC 439]